MTLISQLEDIQSRLHQLRARAQLFGYSDRVSEHLRAASREIYQAVRYVNVERVNNTRINDAEKA